MNGATCHDHNKYYTCHCPYGYTGKDCGEYVDWCATNPCENQATCHQVKNQYQCLCAPGWTGKVCDVEMVSCKDAALRKGMFSTFIVLFPFIKKSKCIKGALHKLKIHKAFITNY